MSKDKYGIIYTIKNKVNNKIYIGQTTQKGGFDRRYKHNIYKYTNNEYLRRSIEKYGIDNFIVNKEFDIAYSKEELDKKEIDYIKLYKSSDPKYGYNIALGGSNGKLGERTKEKLRQANLGKRYSQETNAKKSLPGFLNPMFGKKHSEESKKKISENRIGKYLGKDSGVVKKIRCKTTGKIFYGAREAGDFYGIKSYDHICSVCYGDLKTCGNYKGIKLEWEFVDEDNSKRKFNEDHYKKRRKKILCITTGEIFEGQRAAGEAYGIKTYLHISECCAGKQTYCGKLEDGTPLRWKYI